MFQVQTIWASQPRLSQQKPNDYCTTHINSEMDWQIRGCTHLNPHCIHEQGRKEGSGGRRRETWIGFLKRRTASTSAPHLYIFSVHGSNNSNNSFYTNTIIMIPEKNELIKTQPLVDSGAGEIFMDQNYARKHRFNLTKLEYPITARNVDGTENKQGTIRYYMDLDIQVNGKTNTEQFLITGLENQKIILGLPWLRKHNLEINWKEGTLQ
jgi:Retroviral aspartyl protease